MGRLITEEKNKTGFWFRDDDSPRSHGHKIFVLGLNGRACGIQGLPVDRVVSNFDLTNSMLRFEDVVGGTISALDNNVEHVVDTGTSLTFNFTGGGSLTLIGISGYSDFLSLSMDYIIDVRN